jgi:hypothetical protein
VSIPDDPERLADATSRSPLGELFASAARDLPSDEQLARLAESLGPVLDAAPSAPAASSGLSPLVKLGVATGVVALLVGAGLTLRRSSHSPPGAPTVTASARPPVAETAVTQQPLPAPSPPTPDLVASAQDLPIAPALDKPGAANSKPASAPGKALSEAALLEQARRALSSSPSSALLLANQHRARFPNGVLTQEREVIAIEALRRLHRSSEADQRATGFSKAFPGSAHQRMVDDPAPK